MRHFTLGGRELSRVALGTFPFDGREWGPADDPRAVSTIHAALDAGIAVFDTAPAYGPEHAEVVLGRALHDRRDRAFIATKVGVRWNTVRYYQDLTAASVREECEASLRRLRTDRIDLLQIHWPHAETPLAETMDALAALKAAGKVRHVGVSNFTPEQLEEARRHSPVETLQPLHSLLARGAEETLLPWCAAHGVPVLSYGVLCRGLLAGRFAEGAVPDDFRRKDPFFSDEVLPRIRPFVARFNDLARRLGKPPGQLAIAWALTRPGLSAVIVGARSPEQARANAAAADVTLDAATLAAIDECFADAPRVV
ncbi:MAG TPA: aldo/keto reductase [Planctomycetota bacterium]|nr:aldo/keto reductase [Planctomycetota bacterium]